MFNRLIFLLTIFAISFSVQADNLYQQCLVKALSTASDSMTIAQVKAGCQSVKEQVNDDSQVKETTQPAEGQLVKKRLQEEKLFSYSERVLTGHKPNYIIYSYNTKDPVTQPFEEQYPGEKINFDSGEFKFQISTKFLVAEDVFGDNGDLNVAYTLRTFWQAGNDNISSPFRDYNHEPEVWLSFDTDYELWGFKNSIINLGFVHQSNGRAGTLSRSWNRLYAQFVVEKDNLVFAFKPWYRLKEDKEDDDNRDIEDYMGNFELQSVYKYNEHSFGLMLRNNLHSNNNRGAAQLDWTFPLHKNFKGYLQWFNGYGESLIDYNHNVNAIGIGVKFTDWL